MPWDEDVDVMVSERSIHHLASFYNMSIYSFRLPETDTIQEYLLEVNPHYVNATKDSNNAIDARWIDTRTGLFIDITTLRVDHIAERLGDERYLVVSTFLGALDFE